MFCWIGRQLFLFCEKNVYVTIWHRVTAIHTEKHLEILWQDMTYILDQPTLFSVYATLLPLPNRSCFPVSTIVTMIGNCHVPSPCFGCRFNPIPYHYIYQQHCFGEIRSQLPRVPIAISIVDLPLIHFRLLRAMTLAAHIAASRPVAPWQDLGSCFAR